MSTYRKSRYGVYPDVFGWRAQVVAPDGAQWNAGGYRTEQEARAAAVRSARFYDKGERDRVDGVATKRGTKVIERGVRPCKNCGEPHDCVTTTRRGRRWGQTWEKPGCGTYMPESWEDFARKQVAA